MVPDVGFSSITSMRPSVVLPQPDSPTRPSVSPRRMSNDTPETALIEAIFRWTTRLVTGNSLTRSRTSTRTESLAFRNWPGTGVLRGATLVRGWKHAKLCPFSFSVTGGSVTLHSGVAYRHRGANRQPGGGSLRSGGSPGIEYRDEFLSVVRVGMDSSNASEYGCRIAAKSCPVSADSTTLPAYITTTRSA